VRHRHCDEDVEKLQVSTAHIAALVRALHDVITGLERRPLLEPVWIAMVCCRRRHRQPHLARLLLEVTHCSGDKVVRVAARDDTVVVIAGDAA
jgi:hypothetical protein